MTKDKRNNKYKIIIAIMLVLCSLIHTRNTVDAFPIQGHVTSNGGTVNVRKGPGTGNEIVSRLNKDHPITVISQSDSNNWFEIEFEEEGVTKVAWISNTYVKLEIGEYPEFEEYMNSEKFPEGYKPYLRELHALHPNWKFIPLHTGLDWETVIKHQTTPIYRSLIQARNIASWKSLETGAYNWHNGSWTNFEPGWVAASSDIVKYFMDPRNALVNNGEILQFLSLGWTGLQTKSGVENILKGTFMEESDIDYAQIFMEAGEMHKICPYHLSSRVIQEVGVKGSKSVQGPDYYNFYNIGATGSDDPAQDGLNYAKEKGWDTQEKAIKEGAAFITDKYVKAGQDTMYLQKFNVTGSYGDFWHQYMQNIQAPTNEARNMKKTFPNFNSANFIFKIPVYLNMPKDPSPKPASDADPNYLLSSLSVENYSLTPVFDGFTTSYNLIVPEDETSLKINAKPVKSTTKVTGLGDFELAKGINEIKITSTSQSGKSITYTINVSRGQGDYTPEPTPTPAPTPEPTPMPPPKVTTKYKIDSKKMTGIGPGTTATDFAKNIKVENGTVEVLNPDGSKNTGNVGTGTKVQIKQDNKVIEEWQVVIYGDNNGDGKINIVDLANIQKHILSVSTLEGIYAQASKTSSNKTEVNIVDLANIQKHILNVKLIGQ